jgi:hypothetical protein
MQQRENIAKLHTFLEEKMTNIVTSYNEAIENDLLNIRNQKERITQEMKEN